MTTETQSRKRAYEVFKGERVPIKAWVQGVPVESEALTQLKNTASLRIIYKHLAVMPDVHFGMGATVGSVIPTIGAVIPAAVGVDIGCGMAAVRTNLKASDLPEDLKNIRREIEARVPTGFGAEASHNRGGWGPDEIARYVQDMWYDKLAPRYDRIQLKHPSIKRGNDLNHLGSLGSGNHFIELCLDEESNVWIMLHSGSRGIGNRIGRYFIKQAKEQMEQFKIKLPDKDLAYLPQGTQLFEDYMFAVLWAQDYALLNREIMMEAVMEALPFGATKVGAVQCHHNFVAWEHHYGKNILVTRKGACRAREGEMGIIPGSMGARSYIVKGKGNPESFASCSHGAGRTMSRSKAKRAFSLEDHAKATEGVECRKDAGVLDETPGAYKNIDAVIEAQRDLIEVVCTLKQVMCIKG